MWHFVSGFLETIGNGDDFWKLADAAIAAFPRPWADDDVARHVWSDDLSSWLNKLMDIDAIIAVAGVPRNAWGQNYGNSWQPWRALGVKSMLQFVTPPQVVPDCAPIMPSADTDDLYEQRGAILSPIHKIFTNVHMNWDGMTHGDAPGKQVILSAVASAAAGFGPKATVVVCYSYGVANVFRHLLPGG